MLLKLKFKVMKEIWKFIILVLIALVLGFGSSYLIFGNKKPETIVVVDNEKELKEIDSLNKIISEKQGTIEKLKDSVREKIVVVEKRIEVIKEIPMDSNVELLRDNILVYGDGLTQIDDPYPSLSTTIDGDSIVLLSENNLKDINIGLEKYGGELEINRLLEETIIEDSIIISMKDLIIADKDKIIDKDREAFEVNIKELKKQIRKEKRQKTLL